MTDNTCGAITAMLEDARDDLFESSVGDQTRSQIMQQVWSPVYFGADIPVSAWVWVDFAGPRTTYR